MNFLQYLFGGSRGTFEPEAVRVFLTRTAKWRALCGAVRAAQDAGERVLIVAHFPATLREAGTHLGSAGIAASIRDRPLTSHEAAERIEPPSVLLVPVPAEPDSEGRVPELWLIPAGEGPRSLGVVTTDRAQTIAVPSDLRRALTAGSTLAISLEPVGGSPQGVPTGPIVAKGSITST